MSRYSINGFIEKTSQRDRNQGFFELENDRLLEINLNGTVWTKTGSMIAYMGEIKFTREGSPFCRLKMSLFLLTRTIFWPLKCL